MCAAQRAYWNRLQGIQVLPDRVEKALAKSGFKLQTTNEVIIVYTPDWYFNFRNEEIDVYMNSYIIMHRVFGVT